MQARVDAHVAQW